VVFDDALAAKAAWGNVWVIPGPILRRFFALAPRGAKKDGSPRKTPVESSAIVRPGDTAWARRFADILGEVISDLGGADRLSEGQRQIARRCATIAISCERMEGDAAAGNPIDLETYGQLTDRLGRAFQRLGLKRVPRNVTPSVAEYLKTKATVEIEVA
jgi:hypothetical protein